MINLYNKFYLLNKEIEIERKLDLKKNNTFITRNFESSNELKKKLSQRKNILREIEKKGKDKNNNEFLNKIVNGDCCDYLYKIKPNSIDLFLSDIPYGINLDEWDVFHNNTNSSFLGSSEAQDSKSSFKKRGKPINGWNEEDKENNQKYEEWISIWGNMIFPLMKEGASIFIFGGRRTIHKATNALENIGFLPKDILSWEKNQFNYRNQSIYKTLMRRGTYKISEKGLSSIKTIIDNKNILLFLKENIGLEFKSSRNFLKILKEIDKDILNKYTYELLENFSNNKEILSQIKQWEGWKLGTLAPKIEPISWLIKPYSTPSITDTILKNKVGGINIQDCLIDSKEPTNLLNINFNKLEKGNKIHEAQKPIDLIKFLIKLTTIEGATVLDPFMGSGTTASACKETNRNYIGFEKNTDIHIKCKKRVDS